MFGNLNKIKSIKFLFVVMMEKQDCIDFFVLNIKNVCETMVFKYCIIGRYMIVLDICENELNAQSFIIGLVYCLKSFQVIFCGCGVEDKKEFDG